MPYKNIDDRKRRQAQYRAEIKQRQPDDIPISRTPEYKIWSEMVRRCSTEKSQNYHNYGGRGIKVCDRWLTFSNFLEDMGKRPSSQYTIERRDNNGDYTPDNCYWELGSKQRLNKQTNVFLTIDGQTKTVSEWSKITGIGRTTLYARARRQSDRLLDPVNLIKSANAKGG